MDQDLLAVCTPKGSGLGEGEGETKDGDDRVCTATD